MKRILILLCCVYASYYARAQNINAAEFFIDTDPGSGNGTALSVGTAGADITFTKTIATNGLQEGFHLLGIRVKNTSGTWSIPEKRGFFILSAAVSAANISNAEFFIDTDPGPGNATAMSIGTSGSTVNFIGNINSNGLSQGFHLLCIRVKNSTGTWSLFEKRGFFVTALPVAAPNIKTAEFFVDNDPGAGNATAINIGASGADVNFVANIPTNALSEGFHILCIRTKNTAGTWSLFEKRGFFISTTAAATGIITAAEFFLDTDPGTGKAQPLIIDTPGAIVKKSFSFVLPDGLTDGDHFVGIRFRDANGKWGLLDYDTVSTNGSLPLQFVSFSGTTTNNINILKWVTSNEINTNYFEVERSSNGIAFTKIGNVKATNMNVLNNTYLFTDNHPLHNFNFYRLKEFDKDGSYRYSNIIRLSNSANNNLLISPNPASNIIHIVFASAAEKIMLNIFDAHGRMVILKNIANTTDIQINIANLAAGKYYVQVSDGVQQQNGCFIKE